jgi:hypothetical protein
VSRRAADAGLDLRAGNGHPERNGKHGGWETVAKSGELSLSMCHLGLPVPQPEGYAGAARVPAATGVCRSAGRHRTS